MTTNSITIDSDAIRAAAAQNILAAISGEERASILAQALQTLLEVPRDSYGRTGSGKSPLQSAFEEGVRKMAGTIVGEYLQEEDVKAQITAAIRAAMDERITASAAWLATAVGDAVRDHVEASLQPRT